MLNYNDTDNMKLVINNLHSYLFNQILELEREFNGFDSNVGYSGLPASLWKGRLGMAREVLGKLHKLVEASGITLKPLEDPRVERQNDRDQKRRHRARQAAKLAEG